MSVVQQTIQYQLRPPEAHETAPVRYHHACILVKLWLLILIWVSLSQRTNAEVDELENNISSKLVTILLPSDRHHQTGSEEALTLTVKLDQADDSLLYLPEQQ